MSVGRRSTAATCRQEPPVPAAGVRVSEGVRARASGAESRHIRSSEQENEQERERERESRVEKLSYVLLLHSWSEKMLAR